MKSYGANKTLDIPRNADLSKVLQILDLYDRRTRKVCSRLLRTQQVWIDNEGLQGIQRSKDLLFLWNKWCGNGYDPNTISPLRYKHSLLARLQYAMRLVVDSSYDTGVINLISTVLRLHQSYGVSDTVIQQLTQDSYSAITEPHDVRPLIFGLWDTRTLVYSHGLNESQYNEYLAAKAIQDFLNVALDLDQDRSRAPGRVFHSLRDTCIRLELERAEKLTKASPHDWIPPHGKAVALKSILAEPLDAHAMDSVYTVFNRILTIDPDTGIASLRQQADSGKTIHNIIDDINELLLQAPHTGDTGLVYQRSTAIGTLPPYIRARVGRIVPIKDKAGKIRNIAMTCYTINKTLGPIHRWLFSLLEKFPCDSTKQQKGIDKMVIETTNHSACESKDLSSATDRLPLIVQRRILQSLLYYCAGYTRDQAYKLSWYWHELLASLTFSTPDGNTIRYAVGQPMGVYTSWPMLSLTNHIIALTAKYSCLVEDYGVNINYESGAGRELRTFYLSGYSVCGDDIVIYDKRVAEKYHYLMESLGVRVNRLKSFSTEKGASVSTAEFCKKLVVNGNIVSGQSLKVILRGLGIDDGYNIQPLLLPQVFAALRALKTGKTLSKRQLSVVANSYPRVLHHIPLEFGGLGFPLSGSSCCQVVARDGFIVYYYYNKIRSMLTVFQRNEFSFKQEKQNPASIPGQLGVARQLTQYSSYPDNPNRRYDFDYQQLYQTEWFTDKSVKHNMLDQLRSALFQLESMIQTGDAIEFVDWIDIVDLVRTARSEFIKSRYTVAASSDQRTSDIDTESIDSARTALKSIRMMRKKSNKLLDELESSGLRSVLVSFAEYALC